MTAYIVLSTDSSIAPLAVFTSEEQANKYITFKGVDAFVLPYKVLNFAIDAMCEVDKSE